MIGAPISEVICDQANIQKPTFHPQKASCLHGVCSLGDQIYNRRKLHSALGYKTPEEYKTQYGHAEGTKFGSRLST